MSREGVVKELVWLGSSLKHVREFPEEVRQVIGFALYLAQARRLSALRRPSAEGEDR